MLFGTFIKSGTAQGYQHALIGMVVIAIIGFSLCIFTFIVDMKKGGILNVGEESEQLKLLRKRINEDEGGDNEFASLGEKKQGRIEE